MRGFLIAMSSTLLLACACSQPNTDTSESAAQRMSEPSPKLEPRAVVATVLAALKANDTPSKNAGIATAFAFASPGNRAQTGPLPRFINMVEAGYGALINHRAATIGEPVSDGERLVFPVRVVPTSGAVRVYLFVLAQQDDGACAGCWLTDGVVDQTDQSTPQLTT